MKKGVRLPVSILRAPHLSASAKVIWMFRQVESVSTPRLTLSKLAKISGFTPDTVRRGIKQLRDGGWVSGEPPRHGSTSAPVVAIPVDLILDDRLGVQAKLLYGTLQLLHGFHASKGQFTFSEIASLSSISLNTIRSALKRLEHTGWLRITRHTKFTPIHFTLHNPVDEEREHLLAAIRRRLARSKHYGENLMRECLNLLIDNDEHDDDARPGFLVNPFTGEKLEFDRYYPPKVAFEYNGPQHDGPTDLYPSESEARKQQARDAIKMDICKRRAIKLIVLRREDLSLATLREKLKGVLPLNDLDPNDPVVAHLERVSLEHRTRNS